MEAIFPFLTAASIQYWRDTNQWFENHQSSENCVGDVACAYVWLSQTLSLGCSPPATLHLIDWLIHSFIHSDKKNLPMNMEMTDSDKLEGQEAPGSTCLSLPSAMVKVLLSQFAVWVLGIRNEVFVPMGQALSTEPPPTPKPYHWKKLCEETERNVNKVTTLCLSVALSAHLLHFHT